jgi:hypothetical protein
MKTIIAVFCFALSFSVCAETDAPAANYVMPTTTSEPVNVLSELDDDPEHTVTVIASEDSALEASLAQSKKAVNQKWRSRLKTAMARAH